MNKVCLVQFAKRPVAGFVKTRLMPELGASGALDVHIKLLKTTLQVLHDSQLGTVQLWWDKAWHSEDFFAAESSVPTQFEQQGDDLGARMRHALAVTLAGYSKVLLVGSDCPVLSKSYLQSALTILEHNDIVLGPSNDGGYVLIGARRICDKVLQGIPWGSDTVLADTLLDFKRFGQSCGQLTPLYDVDEFADYDRWQAELTR